MAGRFRRQAHREHPDSKRRTFFSEGCHVEFYSVLTFAAVGMPIRPPHARGKLLVALTPDGDTQTPAVAESAAFSLAYTAVCLEPGLLGQRFLELETGRWWWFWRGRLRRRSVLALRGIERTWQFIERDMLSLLRRMMARWQLGEFDMLGLVNCISSGCSSRQAGINRVVMLYGSLVETVVEIADPGYLLLTQFFPFFRLWDRRRVGGGLHGGGCSHGRP
ncbi:uncharacterized protein PG998_008900 [Apiospora kogelbergensis]|uniref:uncharacterized protein n=1 Tax=Apiospora kogelbergensis TaxID=1337665 RepID=UPI003130A633